MLKTLKKQNIADVFFLLGVDLKWIDSVIEYIENPRLHIVLLFGESARYKSEVSHINFDNHSAIKEIIEMLCSKNRTRPAFFGVQKNDTADIDKANTFAMQYSSDNIYHVDADIEECFQRLYNRISEYDSIICSNDIIAVYLCKRCRECGIDIPKQLYVVGNGGLLISDSVSPRLTTVSYNWESMADIALLTAQGIINATNLSSFDIKIKMHIVDRESTDGTDEGKISESLYYTTYRNVYSHSGEDIDENIREIEKIDSFLSSLSVLDKSIVRMLINDHTYENISNQLFITINTTRYHVKKLYKFLEIHTVQELKEIVNKYKVVL